MGVWTSRVSPLSLKCQNRIIKIDHTA
ncbi:hypothetical protein F383_30521 [Gossypium arboreum]|uniref:Uncharacterized protein n=1 Tax=Gossypium arboreum TaxID=29729 RepID=A0A0B0MXA1_GOSAR|nr:hypothetical protein F383_30521 [Gossypium arboreum]